MTPLETVNAEIAKYEHPFFDFSANVKDDGVELCIRSKVSGVLNPEYRFTFSERDLKSSQFPWTFQRYLYDCLHDYLVEMFIRTPQSQDAEP